MKPHCPYCLRRYRAEVWCPPGYACRICWRVHVVVVTPPPLRRKSIRLVARSTTLPLREDPDRLHVPTGEGFAY